MNFQTRFEAVVNRRKSRPEEETSFLFPGSIFQLLELSGVASRPRFYQRAEPAASILSTAGSRTKF